jgi:hypothetical protein
MIVGGGRETAGGGCETAGGGPDGLRVATFIDLRELAASLAALGVDLSQMDGGGLLDRLTAEGAEAAAGATEGLVRSTGDYLYLVKDTRSRSGVRPAEWAESELAGRSGARLVVVKASGLGECHACDLAGTPGCHHCRTSAVSESAPGVRAAMEADLLRLTRVNAFDVAVIVSADVALIPVVRFVQGRGKRVVHAAPPLRGADLSYASSASIDLGALLESVL